MALFGTIVAGLGVVGSTYLLAGIVSHLVTPFSLLAAVVVAVGVFLFAENRSLLASLGDQRAMTVAHAGLAAILGFITYKAIVWLLAGVAVMTAIVILLIVLVGGLPLLFYFSHMLMRTVA